MGEELEHKDKVKIIYPHYMNIDRNVSLDCEELQRILNLCKYLGSLKNISYRRHKMSVYGTGFFYNHQFILTYEFLDPDGLTMVLKACYLNKGENIRGIEIKDEFWSAINISHTDMLNTLSLLFGERYNTHDLSYCKDKDCSYDGVYPYHCIKDWRD